MTFLDAKGPIKWACDKKRGFFLHNLPLLSQKYVGGLAPLGHMDDAILIVSNEYYFCLSSFQLNVFLIVPWQHAGLMSEGLRVQASLTPHTFFYLGFFLSPFFKFQGGPLLYSIELKTPSFQNSTLISSKKQWFLQIHADVCWKCVILCSKISKNRPVFSTFKCFLELKHWIF